MQNDFKTKALKEFDDGLRADKDLGVTEWGGSWEFNGEYGCDDLMDYFHSFLSQTLDQQIDEIEEMIFQDAEIPAEVCKHIREKLNRFKEEEK